MCGVAGIVSHRGGAVDRDELAAMCAALAHRGPDGEGLWLDDGGRVGLGHRRLSIIDLSERGAQPMHSADGQLVISFNGEIYNYRAIRRALEARGHVFRSDSDTEVLLALYADRGERMFEELRGMYAFALVDRRRGRTLVARDPYGIKPLYLADDGRAVRVASEVKAIARAARGAVSLAAKVGFLLLGSVPEPHTWYEGVRALPAGHFAWIDEEGLSEPRAFASITRVWAGAAASDSGASDVCVALRDSVDHHLVADVPVGAFLSAGVDSSALVALIREAQGNVRTVTITTEEFRGTPADEAVWAERIARRYGATHETHVITAEEFAGVAPRVLAAMDQPTVDGFNTWLVSRAAARAGLKVAVSGLGGDELFGGYPSFKELPRIEALARWPARVPAAGAAWRKAVVSLDLPARLGLSPKLAGLLEYGGSYAGAYFLRRGLFMPWELAELIGEDEAREGLSRFDPLAHIEGALAPDPVRPFSRVAALEATLYMRNQLLRDSDWASMAHGLEVRVPLVDYTLLRSLAPLAAKLRGRAGKRALARCPTEPLPDELVERPKTGFGLPLGRWLDEPAAGLDGWRAVPSLAAPPCHWSRRLAYALATSWS
jgi:asparagine synthase (glutamine-hydrolysing)